MPKFSAVQIRVGLELAEASRDIRSVLPLKILEASFWCASLSRFPNVSGSRKGLGRRGLARRRVQKIYPKSSSRIVFEMERHRERERERGMGVESGCLHCSVL